MDKQIENLFIKDNIPTNLGILFEFVRKSGQCNMITEFNHALIIVLAIGRYVQLITMNDVENILFINSSKIVSQYMDSYENENYVKNVNNMSEGVPYSNSYQNGATEFFGMQWEKNIQTDKALIEQATNYYYYLGIFARDCCRTLKTTDRYLLIAAGLQMFEVPDEFLKKFIMENIF